jgi:hypothetical protein
MGGSRIKDSSAIKAEWTQWRLNDQIVPLAMINVQPLIPHLQTQIPEEMSALQLLADQTNPAWNIPTAKL